MKVTLLKALVVFVLGVMLLIYAVVLLRRHKTAAARMQVLGAGSLAVVGLTHVFEALHVFPSMGWGQENSVGHYIDLCSAVFAGTRFPTGYLLHVLRKRV